MQPATHPDANSSDWHTLILGIGNVLWADEGFGVRCVETLNQRFEFSSTVRVMDGGTQGIFLLPWVRSAKRLLIFDAIDFALVPGTLKRIDDDDVPSYMGVKKVSMHQAGFQEVLASAQLSGEYPDELCLIGAQPALLNDFGGSLTPVIKAQIDPAIRLALKVLEEWGVVVNDRNATTKLHSMIGPEALAMDDYEEGRP